MAHFNLWLHRLFRFMHTGVWLLTLLIAATTPFGVMWFLPFANAMLFTGVTLIAYDLIPGRWVVDHYPNVPRRMAAMCLWPVTWAAYRRFVTEIHGAWHDLPVEDQRSLRAISPELDPTSNKETSS